MIKVWFRENLEKGNFTYWVLLLIMAVLPLHYRYLPPLMILLGIFWLFSNYSSFIKLFSIKSRYRTLLFLFLSLYFWQIVGILYSTDAAMGFSNAFGRLSFILFPLILFNPDQKIKDNIAVILRVFAICTLIYVLSCFGYALFRSVSFDNGILIFNPHPPEYEWENYFFGPILTYSIHPSYLSMFVLLSAFIAFESGKDALRLSGKIFWFLSGFLLLLSVYFISSRAAILAAVILFMFYAIVNIRKTKSKRYYWIGSMLIMVLLLPVFIKNDRVKNFLENASGYLNHNSGNALQEDRIIAWQSSIKLIKKNFVLGVGIGDVRNDLVKEYEMIHADNLSSLRLNTHNQFLETFLENGIIGFCLFNAIFGLMIYISITEKNLIYGIFIIMMFFFFMVETTLYRLAGIAFFSLFSFLLIWMNSPKVKR